MKIKTKFNIKQDVKLVTDIEGRKRKVVKIIIADKGYKEYFLVCGLEQSSHAECEIEAYKQQPKNHVAGFHNKE